jgi:hypothetical protein
MEMTRTEVADVLREFANQLDPSYAGELPVGEEEEEPETDRRVTLLVGNQSATINPPDTVEFDVAVDTDSSLVSGDVAERAMFEITWQVDETEENDEFEIK